MRTEPSSMRPRTIWRRSRHTRRDNNYLIQIFKFYLFMHLNSGDSNFDLLLITIFSRCYWLLFSMLVCFLSISSGVLYTSSKCLLFCMALISLLFGVGAGQMAFILWIIYCCFNLHINDAGFFPFILGIFFQYFVRFLFLSQYCKQPEAKLCFWLSALGQH